MGHISGNKILLMVKVHLNIYIEPRSCTKHDWGVFFVGFFYKSLTSPFQIKSLIKAF